MKEKYAYFKSNLDNLRTTLFQEPRGFDNMLGAFVVEPTQEDADFGVIYAGATQYFEMCGDSTFSVTKTLIETGMIEATEPVTRIRLDTYGGIVQVEAQVKNGGVGDITYQSVPAFFLKTAAFNVPNLGTVTADIAFGGLWYAFIDAHAVKLNIVRKDMKKILALGILLLDELNSQVEVKHPIDPSLSGVTLITFYEKDPEKGVDYKIVNVYGDNATCRSPAGTMSAARAAVSFAKGEVKRGEVITIENGWIGSTHKVRVVEETEVGGKPCVIPELTATAYVTGFYQATLEESDPYRDGFLLNRRATTQAFLAGGV
jgi:proline racemase